MSVNPSVGTPVVPLIEQSVRTVVGAIREIASGGTPTLNAAQRRAFEQAGGTVVRHGRIGGLGYYDPQGNRIGYRDALTASREGFPGGTVPGAAPPPPQMGQPTPPRPPPPTPNVPAVITPPPRIPAPPAPLPGIPRLPAGTVPVIIGTMVTQAAAPYVSVLVDRAINYDIRRDLELAAARREPTRGPGARRGRRGRRTRTPTADRERQARLDAAAGRQTIPAPTRPAEGAAPPELRSARVPIPTYRPNLGSIPAPSVGTIKGRLSLPSVPAWARDMALPLILAALRGQDRRRRARAAEPLVPSLPPGIADPLTGIQPGAVPFPSPMFGSGGGYSSGTGTSTCECKDPRRQRARKKRRTVCYSGTYREKRSGLSKSRRRKIPCR